MSETSFTKIIILLVFIFIMCSILKSAGPVVSFIIGYIIGKWGNKIL